MSEQAAFAELVWARAHDPHPGIVFEHQSVSWADVVTAARARASLATRMRIPERPFHIGILLENVPDYVYWLLAASLAGATAVGINPTRRGAELAGDIRHTDCQLIVTDAAHAPLLDDLDLGVAAARVLRADDAEHARQLAEIEPFSAPPPAAADRLLLLFTSGSTGTPKAVICSQGRLARIAATGTRFGIGRDSVTYIAMPLFHGNSVMANLAMATHAGATMALRRRFSASEFLPDVRRYGVTYFNYVGRALAYILATTPHADDADNTLRDIFGTEASEQDMARFAERFACHVIESYGSSEGTIAIAKVPGTPPHALGRPQPNMTVEIRDPGTGRECPRARFGPSGELLNADEAIGEIVGVDVAGSFEGYYNNPAAEAERLRGGWYWSGDLGYRDGAGFFYFAGRSADWLRVDSENFAAAPVERILLRWRAVVMCAVFPVPDPRTGDQVMAALELADGVEFDPVEFGEFLAAQRDLGTKWAPRFVRIVRQMPLTASNKVDKRPLRRERWSTADAVWWRPGRSVEYVPFTGVAADALAAEFAQAERSHLLTLGP